MIESFRTNLEARAAICAKAGVPFAPLSPGLLRLPGGAARLVQIGYAVPGTVLAVGLLGLLAALDTTIGVLGLTFDEQYGGAGRDVVAALIDGETTLKRLIKQGSKVYLKAENQNYPDLIPTSSLTIQGIAKSVMKRI